MAAAFFRGVWLISNIDVDQAAFCLEKEKPRLIQTVGILRGSDISRLLSA